MLLLPYSRMQAIEPTPNRRGLALTGGGKAGVASMLSPVEQARSRYAGRLPRAALSLGFAPLFRSVLSTREIADNRLDKRPACCGRWALHKICVVRHREKGDRARMSWLSILLFFFSIL